MKSAFHPFIGLAAALLAGMAGSLSAGEDAASPPAENAASPPAENAASPAAAAPAAAAEQPEPVPEAGAPFGLGWLDRTQSLASDSANSLANQLDRFFGAPRSDIEAAYSSLRLITVQSWNDIDNMDSDLRLRGKLYLPKVNERISLIFSEDDGDGSAYYSQDGASVTEPRSTRVNLELNLADQRQHRLDFRVGLRASLKGRASLRYRYETDEEKRLLNRFTQSAYFKDGKGFGAYTRYQLDRALNEATLLRWTSDLRFEETFTGAEWSSALEYLARRSEQEALSYYARVSGETKPDFVASYDLGFRYRKNIYRDWLYLELEPGYTWQKRGFFLPRESTPYMILRLEMAIGTY